MEEIPVIDVTALVTGGGDATPVAEALDRACREHGFFYVSGHGVSADLQARLHREARAFFALPEASKAAVSMASGGRAWRGWFPFEGELTSGTPDRKEGIYFGAELGPEDPRVQAGTPLHGPNRFPPDVPNLRGAVLDYLHALTALGHALMRGLALGLGLSAPWFDDHLTADPLTLFRIFRYPPEVGRPHPRWGVAEHTDYGLLTILGQDTGGGLQVHTPDGWIDANPLPDTFVCNLGDMLERMTSGRYRSTPHRVRNTGPSDRLSFPFFFDPSWNAEVLPIPLGHETPRQARARWDGEDVHAITGTYGEYLWAKVGRVFPDLRADTAP